MDKTIKIIRGVVVTNLVIFGLAACSSSPAPWTQENDSPWGAKRAAESESIPSDEFVTTTVADEPVMLDEPAAMVEPEPISMYEPVAVMAPVIVAEEPLTAEEQVMDMPESNYAIQVYASKTTDSVEKFKADKDLNDLMTIKTDRSGSIVYVLIDVHPDKATATAAAADLEIKTGSKPWVRSIGGLQKIIAQ